MATLDGMVRGALATKDNLTSKDIIEIGHCLEEYLKYKKRTLCSARGYKKDNIKDDIEVIKGILKKFGR